MAKTVVIKRDSSGTTATPINSPKVRYYPNYDAAKTALDNGEIDKGEIITIGESNVADARDASVPVGTILSYYSNNIPSGWLLCDGSEFDIAKYPLLYALLNKNTTPDLRGRAIMGVTDGGTLGQLQDDTIKTHTTGGMSGRASGSATIYCGGVYSGGSSNNAIWISESSAAYDAKADGSYGRNGATISVNVSHTHTYTGAAETRPKNIRLNYIIKAVQGNINEAESAAVKALVDSYSYSYSTSEVATGATWIDGKPIYRRTFTGLAFAANVANSGWTDTGVTIEGVDTLIKGFGVRKLPGYKSAISTIDFQMDGNKVVYQHADFNYTNVNILVLEYTKE